LNQSNSNTSKQIWSIKDSSDLYNIDKWGDKYFSINDEGNISIKPNGKINNSIDLFKLVEEIKSREINPPLILRFNDILKDRIRELHNAFYNSIKNYKYKNIYKGVFPIKCNHQKNMIEKIIEFGSEWNFGLEVGSKSELLIGLSVMNNDNSLLICNGYKDKNYIEMAILARKLGKNLILVIEQRDEVQRIIEAVKKLGSSPIIGIRSKLSSRSSGRWSQSSGQNSKFGLSAPEIINTINELKKANLINELKLLHFHIGSQISDISVIKDALQEGSQIFVELAKLGAPMKYMDVGGGLGIDYDGSKTSSNNSTNYSLQNYANDVIATIKDTCELNKVEQPIIISESGRCITSHCSIFIFNILGTSKIDINIEQSLNIDENKLLIISNLIDTLNQIKNTDIKKDDISKIIELWNDARKFKDDSLASFRLGFISLKERSLAEQLTWACAKEITQKLDIEELNHSNLQDIKSILASTYYGNFSVFKSTPDSWAINQVFPIIPIHRHLEKPSLKASFADLTCDSDGKLNNFINNGTIKSLINLHDFSEKNDYFIGVFLSGSYQEALGNFHNLFGNTNIIHIDIEKDNTYKISNMIKEDSKSEILKVFDYNPDDLLEMIRLNIESAINSKKVTIEESRILLSQIETSLRKSTYLSD
tara:strand:+ start:8885 stop:10837 length:1953 start_codon:yes stop_codon:yes gene_type:complete